MQNITILVVEDNEASRALIAGILKTQGFDVLLAGDGQEAITVLADSNADLALVDLNMEPAGGFAFIKYLRSHAVDLPVVIVTADESSDVLTQANALGVISVLQKPVAPDRLIGTVQKILKRLGRA